MERLTHAEWRLISLALENQRLIAADNVQLHTDHERPDDAARAEAEYEALNRLMTKVAVRTRGDEKR